MVNNEESYQSYLKAKSRVRTCKRSSTVHEVEICQSWKDMTD